MGKREAQGAGIRELVYLVVSAGLLRRWFQRGKGELCRLPGREDACGQKERSGLSKAKALRQKPDVPGCSQEGSEARAELGT